MQNYDNKQEQTLVIIKPDGVQRSLIGEVIMRLERTGLKLVAMNMVIPSKRQALAHYSIDPEWAIKTGTKSIAAYKAKGQTPPTEDPIELAEGVRKRIVDFLASGPVIPMIWQGMGAVEIVRKIIGGTEPLSSTPGTIRGDFSSSQQMNLVHASDGPEAAKREIDIFFG